MGTGEVLKLCRSDNGVTEYDELWVKTRTFLYHPRVRVSACNNVHLREFSQQKRDISSQDTQ